jgi:phospholipid/cholesterol/gamma-HCH transport system permease protein
MKATEQLAGMEMMAVNPITRVIAPRFLGGVIALPLLTALFSGGYGWTPIGVGQGTRLLPVRMGDFTTYMNGASSQLARWRISVFESYDAVPTSEGGERHQPDGGIFFAGRAGPGFHPHCIDLGRGLT